MIDMISLKTNLMMLEKDSLNVAVSLIVIDHIPA